jgi:hypothetical protein
MLEELEERTVPTLLGNQLFPSDYPWNQKITNAPVSTNSAAVMSLIGGGTQFHPDFGQDTQGSNPLYGIPVNVVHGNTATKVNVVIDDYASESDNVSGLVPMPANPVIEGDFQNGPNAGGPGYGSNSNTPPDPNPFNGLDERGDSHLLIYDVDNNIAYEFYEAARPSDNIIFGDIAHTDGKWHAVQESVWNMNTDSFRTIGWTSADAAGLSILAGLARPDEGLPVAQGGQGVINHALRFTLQNSIILDQYIYPGSHVANSNTGSNHPPMGARFRLKASVDISQMNAESKIIAQAMKDYGLVLADNGSNMYLSGASYSVDASNNFTLTWDDNDIQSSTHGLKSLHASDFEMVDLTPIVTDLSVHSGPAGTSVTVIGQNFSGAAGHLSVLFGSTAVAAAFVDDSHVTAVAPAGSGTVDVKVQSGINHTDTANVNNPIFGYGISALPSPQSKGQFTYSVSTAPTVSGVSPNIGLTTGGTSVTITGTNFTGATGVSFGGTAATGFSVNGAGTQITVNAPAHASVTVDVTVTTPNGTSATSSADQFTYVDFADNFNQGNGPLSSSWSIPASFAPKGMRFQYRRQLQNPTSFKVSASAAVGQGTSASVIAAEQVVGPSLLNPTVQADVTRGSASAVGLFARAQSNGDAYVAVLISGKAQIWLYHGATGAISVLGSASYTATPPTTIKFTVTGSGASTTLALTDGAGTPLLTAVTGSALTTLNSAGGVGIFAQGVGGTVDNFSVSGS